MQTGGSNLHVVQSKGTARIDFVQVMSQFLLS